MLHEVLDPSQGLEARKELRDGVQELILARSIENDRTLDPSCIAFLDRAVPDNMPFFKRAGVDTAAVEKYAERVRYSKVLLLEPLPLSRDTVRLESVEEQHQLHLELKESYEALGYQVIEIPACSIEERLDAVYRALERNAPTQTQTLDWKALQSKVHATIRGVGGYWSPLSGTNRVLEELGEPAEALGEARHSNEVAEELADLAIIGTCLANQYSVNLTQEIKKLNENSDPTLGEILTNAGAIARVVNFYEGPKVPEDNEKLPRIQEAIANFQLAVNSFAKDLEINLPSVIDSKLDEMASRDRGRFKASYDPSMAAYSGITDHRFWH